MRTRRPSIVDKHVGARSRVARMEAGKSQTPVAEALGITFQQLQKYEKGTNRISAGKLHEMSRLFDRPVHFFFDGLGVVAGGRGRREIAKIDPLTRFGGTSEGIKIVKAFEKADPSLRRLLAQHVDVKSKSCEIPSPWLRPDVGPKSSVRLDKFVYDPSKSAGSVAVEARQHRSSARRG
jgi:transcriptional regulator with XRE-family HTH domain